ncbi:MAG: hypothetical protein JWN86_3992 [Planctomycetota bacterium]|nr:hypothetical protein [Planctomycetota bacterium]
MPRFRFTVRRMMVVVAIVAMTAATVRASVIAFQFRHAQALGEMRRARSLPP